MGREAEAQEILAALRNRVRLLTIVGGAGVGKTALARHIARRLRSRDREVAWVHVGRTGSSADFAAKVAAGIGLTVPSESRPTEIGLALGRRTVVLDELESAAELASPIVSEWLEASPETAFVVTSRRRLRVPGEVSYRLGTLSPEDGVALLETRMKELDPSVELDPSGRSTARTIVRQLSGLPLAITLAAERTVLFSLEELQERLAEPLTVLRGGREGRHSSLEEAVASSVRMLSEPALCALSQVSAFRGGFTVAAAENILQLPGERTVAEVLEELVDHSLLVAHRPDGNPEARLVLDAAVEAFAEAGLNRDARESIFERHAEYYLSEAGRYDDPFAIRAWGPADRRRWAEEIPNLRALCERRQEKAPHDAARASVAMYPGQRAREPIASGHLRSGLEAARRSGDGPLEAKARFVRVALLAHRAPLQELWTDLEQAVHAASEVSPHLQAHLLHSLGTVLDLFGHPHEAERAWQRALVLAEQLGEDELHASVLYALAWRALRGGDAATAIEFERRASALSDDPCESFLRGELLHNLAWRALSDGSIEEGLALAAEAVDLRRRESWSLRWVGSALLVGMALHERGDLSEAQARYREVIASDASPALRLRAQALLLGIALEEGPLEGGERLVQLAAIQLAAECEADGDPIARGTAHAYLALCHVADGELEEASVAARTSRELLRTPAPHLDLCRAVEGLIERLRHLSSRPPAEPLPEEASIMARLGDRAVRSIEERVGRRADSSTQGELTLRIGSMARWVELPHDGRRVDLRRRGPMRRCLVRLAEQHEQATALDVWSLWAAGWPGEAPGPNAAQRVYTTMDRLRGIGLRTYVLKWEEGYLLDPELRIEWAEEEDDSAAS